MNVRTMRAVDWYAGVPLCYLLAVLRRLTAFLRGGRPDRVRRIAVIKLLGSGSLLLAAPAIRALRATHPGARITVVTFAENREVVELLGLADETVTIRRDRAVAFVADTLRAVRRLRRASPDLAVDLEFFSKYSLALAACSGARTLAGYHLTLEPWRRSLLDVRGYYNHYWHVKDIFLSLAYLLATNDLFYVRFDAFIRRFPPPALRPDTRTRNAMRRRLRAAGFGRGPLFVVHPGTSADTAPELKRWPEAKWGELIGRLCAAHGAGVVVTGSAGERGLAEAVRGRVPARWRGRVANWAGETRLTELPALFAAARAVVAVDSGPMHLAALSGAHVVGLFLAETPVLYAPLATRGAVVAKRLYSLPAFTVYTGKQPVVPGNLVARQTGVPEVLAAVRRVL
ncbi:MAG: glycosyltransferase family 9 protein [Candidatus Coatesbacteria bacterium]